MGRLAASATAVVIVASATSSASALTIIPIYDSSVTSLTNAAAIEAAFQSVANQFDSTFATAVTLKIGVSFGTVDGKSLGSGNVAASLSGERAPYTFSSVVSALSTAAARNPMDPNIASLLANLPATSPAGAVSFGVPYAEAQALGLLPATISLDSGFVGFSSSVTWDLNPADGVAPGAFDFQALAAHEISEVMGRVSGLQSSKPTLATIFDLLRYSAPGVSSFSYSNSAYASIDGGVTDLGDFNVSGAGDRGDWNAIAGDAQDATIRTGKTYSLSTSDLTVLDVLGWGPWTAVGGVLVDGSNPADPAILSDAAAVPEPRAWVTMVIGFALVGAACRRRARGVAASSLT